MFTLQQLLLNICAVECESHVVHMQALLLTLRCLQIFRIAQPMDPRAALHANIDQASDTFDCSAQPTARRTFGFAEACAEFWKPFNSNREADKIYLSKKYPQVRQSSVAIALDRTSTSASMQV